MINEILFDGGKEIRPLRPRTKPITDALVSKEFEDMFGVPSDRFYRGSMFAMLLSLEDHKTYMSTSYEHSKFLHSSVCGVVKFGEKNDLDEHVYDINSAYPFIMMKEFPHGKYAYSDSDSWINDYLGIVEVENIVEPIDLEINHPLTHDIIKMIASKNVMTSECYKYLKSIGYSMNYVDGCLYEHKSNFMANIVSKLYALRKVNDDLNKLCKTEMNIFIGKQRKRGTLVAVNRMANYEISSYIMFYHALNMIKLIEEINIPWKFIYVDSISFQSQPPDSHVSNLIGGLRHVKN